MSDVNAIYYIVGGVCGGFCAAVGAIASNGHPATGALIGMLIFGLLTPLGINLTRRI